VTGSLLPGLEIESSDIDLSFMEAHGSLQGISSNVKGNEKSHH